MQFSPACERNKLPILQLLRAWLPANARVTHVSLFDGSLQGFALTDKPAFCFQGHPEASPGPHDVDYLFNKFVKLMEQRSART